MVPGGVLGLIWNIEDCRLVERGLSIEAVVLTLMVDNGELGWESTTKWEDKIKELIWSSGDTEPRFRHAKWQEVFDEQLKSSPLSIQTADPMFSLPLGEHIEKWTVWLPDKEAVCSRVMTISHIANLKGQEAEVSLLSDPTADAIIS